jgi:hypothetical protein
LERLFGGEVLFEVASYSTPPFFDYQSNTRLGKNIQMNKKAPTTKYAKIYAFALTLNILNLERNGK